jgi:hypothetical protein
VTLLTIVQQVCRLTGLRVPTEVVDSTDTQVQQLYALANEEGQELARSFEWQALTREQTFTTTATAIQAGAIPDDMDHFLSNTSFNRSTRLTMIGPITPQLWQAIQAQPQLNRVYLAWRQRDNEYLVTPDATADQTVAFEYVSTEWAEAANGDPQDEFLADNDTTVLAERLFVYGIRWRFLSAKNLDYAEAMRTYQEQLQMAQARDGGSTQLNITGSTTWGLWGFPNLPLGNFPS